MSEAELIRQTVRATLVELGYKPRNTRQYISQNQALKILKPVRIGRARLTRLVNDGVVKAIKSDYDVRNSAVNYNREDIYKLLNQ